MPFFGACLVVIIVVCCVLVLAFRNHQGAGLGMGITLYAFVAGVCAAAVLAVGMAVRLLTDGEHLTAARLAVVVGFVLGVSAHRAWRHFFR